VKEIRIQKMIDAYWIREGSGLTISKEENYRRTQGRQQALGMGSHRDADNLAQAKEKQKEVAGKKERTG